MFGWKLLVEKPHFDLLIVRKYFGFESGPSRYRMPNILSFFYIHYVKRDDTLNNINNYRIFSSTGAPLQHVLNSNVREEWLPVGYLPSYSCHRFTLFLIMFGWSKPKCVKIQIKSCWTPLFLSINHVKVLWFRHPGGHSMNHYYVCIYSPPFTIQYRTEYPEGGLMICQVSSWIESQKGERRKWHQGFVTKCQGVFTFLCKVGSIISLKHIWWADSEWF